MLRRSPLLDAFGLAALLAASGGAARAQTPAPASPPAITVPYERFTLPNGLDVVLHRDPATPAISVNTWYHVGSGSERPGRTGFAHLFEHLMFEGSGNVPEGAIDTWLEEAGGNANGSTSSDRTNYTTEAASNALELALYLDADRMAHLLDAMTPAKVDAQRDVVKNERRQSYENQPYGLALPILDQYLYPAEHPYHWPTIGSMDDLTAASYDDVTAFFRRYYVPNNATLVVAGDLDVAAARGLVEKWYGSIPRGPSSAPLVVPPVRLEAETRLVHEDRVELPRLYLAWHTPARYAPGDAEMDVVAGVLGGGKNSRLYRRLVYDLQIAQDVSAFQSPSGLGSTFYVVATARPGRPLGELERAIQTEIDGLKAAPPAARELARVVNRIEADFLDGLESVSGKADALNGYLTWTGNPDFFNEDLARYHALAPADVRAAVQSYLRDAGRVVLSVVPQGQSALAADRSAPAANKY